MKIYGQTLPDIFAKLPWPYKIVVAVGSAFIAYTALYVPYALVSGFSIAQTPAMLKAPEGTTGMTDPSLVYDTQRERALLAYTAEQNADDPTAPKQMHVRMAIGNAKCGDWQELDAGFNGKPDNLLAPDGEHVLSAGAWRVETPSLLHDPDDAEAPWKLYAYKYFWSKDATNQVRIASTFGAIVYKSAVDPINGPWSQEQWLFSPGNAAPPAPYGQMVLLHLNKLDPSLNTVTAYARPSAVYKDGAIFMTLSAFAGSDTPDRIVMITSKDHGKSWAYAGTPLTSVDARALGYSHIAGATLIQKDKQLYLAASFGSSARFAEGASLLPFDNATQLKRTRNGKPVIASTIPLFSSEPGLMGGGFVAYDQACASGLLTGEQSVEAPNFRIMKTYKQP